MWQDYDCKGSGCHDHHSSAKRNDHCHCREEWRGYQHVVYCCDDYCRLHELHDFHVDRDDECVDVQYYYHSNLLRLFALTS